MRVEHANYYLIPDMFRLDKTEGRRRGVSNTDNKPI